MGKKPYWIVKKRMEIAAAHKLDHLSYESACKNWHGHNWIITVYCKCTKLNEDAMVIDFKRVKERIHGVLDHECINNVIPKPTAENIAKWVAEAFDSCCQVDVQESEGNSVTYMRNG